jgi:septal ring factor EnvC (AmiA/AmiB activator)
MEDKWVAQMAEALVRIEKLEEKTAEIDKKQQTIYELTSDIKVIANSMGNFKEAITEIKVGQKELGNKMDNQIKEVKAEIKRIDNKSKIDFLEYFKIKVMPWILGAGFIGGIAIVAVKIIGG